jgi:excisionase family DNA binding protein
MTATRARTDQEGRTLTPEQLLTQSEVAALLKVSTRTVRRLRIRRVKVGRSTRYRPADVQRYIDKLRAA